MPRHRPAPELPERVVAMFAEARASPAGAAGSAAAGGPEQAGGPAAAGGPEPAAEGPRSGPGRVAGGWVPTEPDPAEGGWVPSAPPASVPDASATSAGGSPRGRHRDGRSPSVLTLPKALRGARTRPSGASVLALVVVLVCAGVVFGVRVALAQRAAEPEAARPGQASGTPASGTQGSGTPASGVIGRSVPPAFAAPTSTAGPTPPASPPVSPPVREIVVHVVGQVATPGVVRLGDGARVTDALAVAGGPLPAADLQHVNLARVLTDGEQVYVPKPGETAPAGWAAAGAPGAGGPGAGGPVAPAAGPPGGAGRPTGLTGAAAVDLNTADLAALDSLPGVGPVLAQRIIDWRRSHGRFSSVEELAEVTGIGEKLLAGIRSRVRV